MRGTARTEDERARLVGAYAKSGLSVQAFARREGIPPSSLYQWLAKRGNTRPASPGVPMARVVRRRMPADGSAAPRGTSATVVFVELSAARVHVTAAADRDTLADVFELLALRRDEGTA
jgi:transposase-like protein